MDNITQDVSWKREVNIKSHFNLSSTVRSAGGLWLLELCAEETAVGYCGQNILCVMCVATDRQNTPIIRMCAKIDWQLLQVCLSVFLSARNTWEIKDEIS